VLEVGVGPSFRGCLHLEVTPPSGPLGPGVATGIPVLVIAGDAEEQRAYVEVVLPAR
jgi:hypothetical protein